MRLNEYGERMIRFDRSPGTVWYYGLGVAGEAGELADKIKKLYRDKLDPTSESVRAFVLGELGDVTWYMTRTGSLFGFTLEDIAAAAPWDGLADDGPKEPWYYALRMVGVTGRIGDVMAVAEHPLPEQPPKTLHLLGSLYYYVRALGHYFGYTMEQITQANLDKLSSREQRGKLHGEGDNR